MQFLNDSDRVKDAIFTLRRIARFPADRILIRAPRKGDTYLTAGGDAKLALYDLHPNSWRVIVKQVRWPQ